MKLTESIKPYFAGVALFLILLSSKGWAQPTRISAWVTDGTITRTYYDRNGAVINPDLFHSFFPMPSSGMQKTYIINSVITLTVTSQNPSCGRSNGSIAVAASGGTAPYTYYCSSPGVPLNEGNFPNLNAGTYTITVTDANGQSMATSVTLVNTLIPPNVTVSSIVRPNGCTGMDGVITLTASNGTPPYQYSLDLQNFQSSNVFTLPYGLYDFFVRDANGCYGRFNGFDILTQFSPTGCNGSYGASYSAFTCGNNGNIHATGGNVNGPYTYSLDGINYQSSQDFNNLPPGVYYIYYKNVLGQVRIFGIVIQLNCSLNYNEIIVDATCHQHDGSITINAYSGTPPYTYSIDGINFQTSNTFTNLAPGYYYATAKDAISATASFVLHVGERCPTLSVSTTNESCSLSNGTITATASNGTAPYQYSLDGVNYQTNNIFTGLAAGTYTVTTKDALGNTANATATIISGCLTVVINSTNTACSLNNGSITITASGGSQPYRYSLDGVNFQASNIFTGLAAASYTITVKDQVNVIATANITLTDVPGPSISFVVRAPSCNANDGTVTITGTGGTTPLQYSIDGINFQTGNVFTAVLPGNYVPTVKDANGCSATVSTTINIDCPTITAATANEICGNSNGSITTTAANGIPPYQYSIDGINFQSAPVFSNLPAGTYTITVKDNPGYTNSTTVTISGSCPEITAIATASTCGNANGVITATGSNGVTPYQYSLNGINFQSSSVFPGLSAGPFTVTIKDAINTLGTTNVVINNIAGPQISVISTNTTCANNDGSITIAETGGTAPIGYSLTGSNYQTINQFGNLTSGIYNPVIKDANGCTSSIAVTVSLDNNLTLQTIPLTICEGGRGNLLASSNGTSFAWTPASNLDNNQLLSPVTSSSTTTHYFITASLGVCSKKDSVWVTVNPAPHADAGDAVSICKGQGTMLNGSGGVRYSWSPATYLSNPTSSNPVVNSPSATITYSLLVTDANNCQSLQPSPVTVTVISALKVFAGNDTSVIINKPFQLSIIDINNVGFSQYTWSPVYGLNDPNSQQPTVTLDRDITYQVIATTLSGCKATDNITIKVYRGPDIYVPSAFSPNNDGLNDLLIATPVGIKTFQFLSVFNRWGQRIFYSSDHLHGWDGTIAGSRQDTGIYVWLTQGLDEKGNLIQRKGTVMLIR